MKIVYLNRIIAITSVLLGVLKIILISYFYFYRLLNKDSLFYADLAIRDVVLDYILYAVLIMSGIALFREKKISTILYTIFFVGIFLRSILSYFLVGENFGLLIDLALPLIISVFGIVYINSPKVKGILR